MRRQRNLRPPDAPQGVEYRLVMPDGSAFTKERWLESVTKAINDMSDEELEVAFDAVMREGEDPAI